MLSQLLCIAAAYLLGCVSTGYYLVRLQTGTDVRAQGTGSTGARNVGRLLGRRGFAIVFTGDLVKGVAAVGLARALDAGPAAMTLAALAVVAGHVFPAHLGFRGGKGACTSFGALLVLDAPLALAGAAVCALLVLVLRHAVHAFMAAFTLLPLVALALGTPPWGVMGIVALWLLILAGFRDNLAALARRDGPMLSAEGVAE